MYSCVSCPPRKRITPYVSRFRSLRLVHLPFSLFANPLSKDFKSALVSSRAGEGTITVIVWWDGAVVPAVSAMAMAHSTCASGHKLTYLGIGAANYAVFNVQVKKPGVYRMEVDSMTTGTRSFIINVNNSPAITLNLSGGSSTLSGVVASSTAFVETAPASLRSATWAPTRRAPSPSKM